MIGYTQALQHYKNIPLGRPEAYGGWEGRSKRSTAEFVHLASELEKKTPRYFGVEMELDENLYIPKLQELIHPFGHVYADGSPASEVVTSPATLRATKTIVQRFWRKFKKAGLSHKPKRHLGSHIHFSGSPKHMEVARFINLRTNNPFTTLVAQRPENGACYRFSDADMVYRSEFSKGAACSTLTGHRTTEVRIFRSPKGPAEVCKNVEFVDALCAYHEETNADDMKVDPFIAWLASHKRPYPHLSTFLKKEGVL